MEKSKEQPKLPEGETLCWYCANAVPDAFGLRGCPWSLRGKPVTGWAAKKQKCGEWTSYLVRRCPLFIQDRRPERTYRAKNETRTGLSIRLQDLQRFTAAANRLRRATKGDGANE